MNSFENKNITRKDRKMKDKTSNLGRRSSVNSPKHGFTLVELLLGSSIMLIIIVATLSLYMRSNKVAVDQQQFAELQHDVRSGMFFISRDGRMAGAGLPIEYSGYFLEGIDNELQGVIVAPDRLKLMGNIEEPLNLNIDNYQGAAANLKLEDYSLEQYPYPDEYYENKIVLILPNPSSGCMSGQIREITHVTHSAMANERLNFSPGLAQGINPPGGLSGTCSSSNDYDGGFVTFIEVKEYWLDITGNYPGLSAGVNGYIGNGEGSVLYLTQNGIHYPLAKDIENLQFQYNGDLDNDGNLDGFIDWQVSWTGDIDLISRIRQVRIFILGKTQNAYVSISGSPPPNLHLYRRPLIANSPKSDQDDKHRRFLLVSTAMVRNLSLNLYNMGTR